jgi:Raf kinase inhibitor-like YbhB/YbcL family protein
MELQSDALKADETIPSVYTCDGKNRSPHLAWSHLPAGTRSLALIVDDPDAPNGTFGHWGLYDIPPEMTHLDEGFSRADAEAEGIRQVLNDFGHMGYDGPCPPRGHGVHHYRFRLFALDVNHLELPHRANCRDLEEAVRPHILARAGLTATYSR